MESRTQRTDGFIATLIVWQSFRTETAATDCATTLLAHHPEWPIYIAFVPSDVTHRSRTRPWLVLTASSVPLQSVRTGDHV